MRVHITVSSLGGNGYATVVGDVLVRICNRYVSSSVRVH